MIIEQNRHKKCDWLSKSPVCLKVLKILNISSFIAQEEKKKIYSWTHVDLLWQNVDIVSLYGLSCHNGTYHSLWTKCEH